MTVDAQPLRTAVAALQARGGPRQDWRHCPKSGFFLRMCVLRVALGEWGLGSARAMSPAMAQGPSAASYPTGIGQPAHPARQSFFATGLELRRPGIATALCWHGG